MNRESEYQMILRMLEEGKIDAEEAEKLLGALGEPGSGAGVRSEDPVKEASDIDADPGDLSGMIKGVVSSLKGTGLMGAIGPAQTYSREIKGRFDPTAVQERGFIEVKGAAKNGRIEVQGWDSDEYRVVVQAKVRGGERDQAREVAEEYCKVEEGEAALTVEGRENLPTNSSVSLEIFLPEDYVYDIDLVTSNGRLHLVDLCGRKVLGRTSNGRIACDDVRAKNFDLKTSNGRIQVEGAVGDVAAKTTNGAIRIVPREVQAHSRYRARTTNGKIALDYAPGDEVGVSFEARTTNGKIDIPWDDLDLEIDRRRGRRRTHIKGTTAGYEDKDLHLQVELKTTNGAIKFGA